MCKRVFSSWNQVLYFSFLSGFFANKISRLRLPNFLCKRSDTKTLITWFLLWVLEIKEFDAVTSSNTAAAQLVLLFCLRRCFRTSFNAKDFKMCPRGLHLWYLQQAWSQSLVAYIDVSLVITTNIILPIGPHNPFISPLLSPAWFPVECLVPRLLPLQQHHPKLPMGPRSRWSPW